MLDCTGLIEPALEKAVQTFDIREDGNGCLVQTPFQHPDGDLLKVWVEHDRGDFYTIRDYGETFAYLKLRGTDPSSEARQDRIANITKQYDLESSAGEVRVRAKKDRLGPRLLDAVQALMAISHLVYTHRKQTPSRFNETVGEYLNSAGYDFEPNVTVEGSNKPRKFDFSINHRDPTTLLDTIHTNDRYDFERKTDAVLLNWHEVKDSGYQHGLLVDDVDGILKQDLMKPLRNNLDYIFQWQYREAITQDIPITADT